MVKIALQPNVSSKHLFIHLKLFLNLYKMTLAYNRFDEIGKRKYLYKDTSKNKQKFAKIQKRIQDFQG